MSNEPFTANVLNIALEYWTILDGARTYEKEEGEKARHDHRVNE